MTAIQSLKIPLLTIPDTGRSVPVMLLPEYFQRWREEDPDLEISGGEITGTALLARHGRDVLVRGDLEGRLELACSRCLERYATPVKVHFDLLLAPGPPGAVKHDEELGAADLDLDFYQGDVIELENLLREQIILMVPLKPLCADNCRGLCPRCGGNLTAGACDCP